MQLEIRPLANTFGAEVLGVDPAQMLSPEVQSALQDALKQYDLLLLRNVDFDEPEQARFARIFGEPPPPPFIPSAPVLAAAPTQYVSNTRGDGMLPNGELAYHQDHLFDEEPVRIIMLYGVEIPVEGGATKFRSCTEMYERMDAPMREKAKDLRCLHLFDYESVAVRPPTGDVASWDADLKDQKSSPFSLETASPNAPRTWKPLIWRNPDTGAPVVWCNHGTTVAFDGLSEDDGRALLDEIVDRAEEVEEYVHNWRPGDLLFWNNLTLQHARLPFSHTEKRTLRRSTLV